MILKPFFEVIIIMLLYAKKLSIEGKEGEQSVRDREEIDRQRKREREIGN